MVTYDMDIIIAPINGVVCLKNYVPKSYHNLGPYHKNVVYAACQFNLKYFHHLFAII